MFGNAGVKLRELTEGHGKRDPEEKRLKSWTKKAEEGQEPENLNLKRGRGGTAQEREAKIAKTSPRYPHAGT